MSTDAVQGVAVPRESVIPLPDHDHFTGDRSDIFADGSHRLAVFWVKNHRDLALHTHDFVELVLILDGTADHLLQEGGYQVSAGDVFVIKPGVPHGYGRARNLELVNILFDPVRLRLPLGDLALLHGYHALFDLEPSFRVQHRFQSRLFLAPAARREITGLVRQLTEELRVREPGYKSMSLALLLRVVGRLSRAYSQMTKPVSQTLLAINRVVSYIENHYASPLTAGELAAKAGTCERSLQRYFQRAFGVSPTDYLNRLRVKKASELLLESELNVTEVADAVGITDSNYFARLFHRETGLSPSSFRRSWHRLPQPDHPFAYAMEPAPETRS
jgi:AraC family L-rhamnose operon transcriptional activator RhaR